MTRTSGFIRPHAGLAGLDVEQIHKELDIEIYSGARANFLMHQNQNYIFDDIVDRQRAFQAGYEDQCTSKYYFDLFNAIRNVYGEVSRIVEVGVFMGGASSILAGCAHHFNLDYDLIDVNAEFLQFSHERIRRTSPEMAERVRLFHGDLPSYVRDVLMSEPRSRVFVQHDGSHRFDQVVRDLGSLYYVRDQVHSIAIQDTHLRGMPQEMNFVDAALFAIFGSELRYEPIGSTFYEGELLDPNKYQGNYFVAGMPEGMVLPLNQNQFLYPHHKIPFQAFFE